MVTSLNGRKPFTLSSPTVKFSGVKHCGSGAQLFICHVMLQDQMIKGSCNFMNGSPSQKATPSPPCLLWLF